MGSTGIFVGNNLDRIIIVNLSVHPDASGRTMPKASAQGIPMGPLGKDQGCEIIGGGRGISATFYQWSIAFKAYKIDVGRYDKRVPQIFQIP